MMTTIQKLIDKKNPKMWGAGSIEKEMFSCDLCSRDGFKSIIALQSHMRDAHKYFDSLCTTSLTESINLPSFPCGICKRLFRSKFGLISHWQDAHNDLFVFFDKSNATSSFSEQRTYCCTICNRNLKSLIGLLAHQRDAHYFKSAQCDPPLLDDWPDKIIAEIYLVEQISSKDISPLILPCKHCRRSFRALLDLRAHERDSHGVDIINNNYYNDNNTNNACSNDTIPCNQCRRVFRTMFGLYIHQRDAHGLVPKSISVFYQQICNYFHKIYLTFNLCW